ncbi:MAG TPA: hypothetical protein VE422_27100 [Terriglobia bacterium]|nr:hypothetical protein [Terriglobia bacterium]
MRVHSGTFSCSIAMPITTPELRIEAPPELAAFRARLDSLDPKFFAGILQFLGIRDAGPAIRVILAPESSDRARQTPPWIAGFAVAAADLVVIFPARTPGYPDNSLEDVLRHEVAHVLVARAAAGQSVPRWFNEGLAMASEGSWGLEDQTRVLYELALGPRITLNEIDRLFLADRRGQDRAYALSGAFTRDLLLQHGSAAPGRILDRLRRGSPFDVAFSDGTGRNLSDAESEFWRRQRIWTTWVPIVTSSATLWLLVTIIAILAIRRRRQKDAEIRKRWDEEEPEPNDEL